MSDLARRVLALIPANGKRVNLKHDWKAAQVGFRIRGVRRNGSCGLVPARSGGERPLDELPSEGTRLSNIALRSRLEQHQIGLAL